MLKQMCKITLLLAPVVLLTSCKTIGPETKSQVTRISCQGWDPIYVSKQDILTKQTADEILAHNKFGAKQCGWKPKSKPKLNG